MENKENDTKIRSRDMAKLFINEKHKKGQVRPEIYGHFSEHLGRCIYEGLYV